MEDYEWQMAKQDQDAKWVTEDFQKNLERQNRLNEINMHNLDVVAGLSGVGFSKRGME
ncbi:MAG: hypothetical protein LBG59_07585 [Candidatus Peribacteria bacterium]|nr:hypothetical protein [Candidatus Peribacteria bacterium]